MIVAVLCEAKPQTFLEEGRVAQKIEIELVSMPLKSYIGFASGGNARDLNRHSTRLEYQRSTLGLLVTTVRYGQYTIVIDIKLMKYIPQLEMLASLQRQLRPGLALCAF